MKRQIHVNQMLNAHKHQTFELILVRFVGGLIGALTAITVVLS